MSGFTPMTQAQLADLAATAFASQPGVVAPNTDPGSALGPAFNAAALLATYIQNELTYIVSIERMANIPALPSGLPNPDLDSFCAPFGVTRLAASFATGSATCSTPSPVQSRITVPAGAIVATPAGVQFVISANGPGYDSGTGGYDIPANQSSVVVPLTSLTAGTVGNVAAGTQFTATGGGLAMPPAVNSITNAAAFSNAEPDESDAAFKTRFTLTVSSGRVATQNAIIAATLAVQPGIIYSFGDRVNLDLTEHDAYFTLVVNLANTGVAPSAALLASVINAIEGVNGTFASGTLTIGGTPTVGDTVSATLVNGVNSVTTSAYTVQAGDTVATIATALTNLILASPADVFVSASSTGAVITVTAVAFGTAGNAITIQGTATGGHTTITPTTATNLTGGTLATTTNQAVRAAGISYQVVGPTIESVNGSGSITPTPQFIGQQTAVNNAVNTAFAAFVNGIGLNTDTTPTVCSIARCYAALLATTINGVPCVFDVQNLLLNGSGVDISFPFGQQCVAGSAAFTATE